MIKFLLNALNNCNTKNAKYIKSLYYRYCQYLYDEVNDSIYNNEDLFKLFINEFIDVDKVIEVYDNYKVPTTVYYYKIERYIFKTTSNNEHTIAHLRSIIANKNKYNGLHTIINKDERITKSFD